MSDKVKVAHPAMLVLARESRGMTQADLAAAMSSLAGETAVSQGYVSRAESGRLAVSGERLELYAKALRYPSHLLCREGEVHGIGVGLVHHRKRASLGAQALRRIHAELALSRLQARALVAAVAVEQPHRFRHIEVDDLNTPADAARVLRKEWQMPAGPVARLVEVIEKAGGFILIRDLGTRKLDAVSQWATEEVPLFLLNQQAPTDRFRWSLAHELGHIMMHTEPGSSSVQERQADEFATEFLMPATSIRAGLRGEVDLNKLLSLKQQWGVSMATLARRALSLGVISDWQYRNLMIEMSALGYRTQEPGAIAPERPWRLRTLITRLEHDLGYSPQQVAELVGLLPDELQSLYPTDSTYAHNIREAP
jgi:Zn-dependent peptidase ImmA (M78 family)/transcriptional regulator with XRE-family HTH domain